jgi:hypothetical protein
MTKFSNFFLSLSIIFSHTLLRFGYKERILFNIIMSSQKNYLMSDFFKYVNKKLEGPAWDNQHTLNSEPKVNQTPKSFYTSNIEVDMLHPNEVKPNTVETQPVTQPTAPSAPPQPQYYYPPPCYYPQYPPIHQNPNQPPIINPPLQQPSAPTNSQVPQQAPIQQVTQPPVIQTNPQMVQPPPQQVPNYYQMYPQYYQPPINHYFQSNGQKHPNSEDYVEFTTKNGKKVRFKAKKEKKVKNVQIKEKEKEEKNNNEQTNVEVVPKHDNK